MTVIRRRQSRHSGATWIHLTRRCFVLASAALALLPRAGAAARGKPFSDGSWFADDGTGWVD